MQRATRLEFAAFGHENIALDRPSHLHRFGPDFTAYAPVLLNRERSSGIDCALHLAVDEQLVQEFDRAFDRNSSGEKSAGLRWHGRAVEWSRDDRWVWLIRLRAFGFLVRGKATGEQSGLQTHIAMMESVSLVRAPRLHAVVRAALFFLCAFWLGS
jgi:hypothetical protein